MTKTLRTFSPDPTTTRYRPSSHSHHQFLELLAVHEAASSIRLECRLWSIHRLGGAHGFCEEKVGQWHRIAQTFPIPGEADDYLDKRYLRTYRVDSRTFQFLLRQTGKALQRSITRIRQPIPLPKALQCACTGLPMASLLTSWASYMHWCVNCTCRCACCSFCF